MMHISADINKYPTFDYSVFTAILNKIARETLEQMKLGLMKDTPERAKRMWEFVTAGDERVCYICSQHDGNKYTLDDIRFNPPLHNSCRCRMELITDPFILDHKEGKLMHKHPYAIEEEFGSEDIEPKGFFRRNSFEGVKFFVNKIEKEMGKFFFDSFRP